MPCISMLLISMPPDGAEVVLWLLEGVKLAYLHVVPFTMSRNIFMI
jgi:hypothetical protein